ncbi:cytochrome C oxidase subunit I [Microvenator marinus]|uniref:Cytochrome C oxidase subunit I n=2 Tax=Microvenator marinus TaxID=2600177 RepID=A0A5B8XWU1_9DELT|nr:cytochrome C oxidase subunit I [Microvenator marinus]
MRRCDTTGLPVCLDAQAFIKLNAVMAVVYLLVGAIAALLLVLTRWPAVHLLDTAWFYRILTLHGINMLIFWILFFEVAVLYFACTTLLNTKLFSRKLAWVSFGLMVVGSVMTDYTIFMGKADVMMTSYLPLLAHPLFYLGIILVAVGTLVGVGNFFGTLYVAKRDKNYEGSMPLVTFGAMTAAIIAVLALLHGAIALVPTFTFSLGLTPEPDPMWYRLIWWGLGHQSQQVNVAAMVSIWYLISYLTTGAKPINEFVSRAAFLLYILFINLASAHHLLVDPGVGAGWKIWNTSYAMYLAVLASLIHGFTVPAGMEIGMRIRGYGRGLFGWLWNAPWKNPAFSGFFLSLVIFGFIGGITGVTLGTQQINILAHNTMRIPGHFHATVVGGTTLSFMAVTYYVVPLFFQRDYPMKWLARLQPYIFAIGIVMVSLGMSFAGTNGVARRTWDIDAAGIYGSTAHLMLGIMGVGGVLAFTGLLIYILLTVWAVFFGESNKGRAIFDWGTPPIVASQAEAEAAEAEASAGRAPGTMVLVMILLISFVVYYFANWKALADLWWVR